MFQSSNLPAMSTKNILSIFFSILDLSSHMKKCRRPGINCDWLGWAYWCDLQYCWILLSNFICIYIHSMYYSIYVFVFITWLSWILNSDWSITNILLGLFLDRTPLFRCSVVKPVNRDAIKVRGAQEREVMRNIYLMLHFYPSLNSLGLTEVRYRKWLLTCYMEGRGSCHT